MLEEPKQTPGREEWGHRGTRVIALLVSLLLLTLVTGCQHNSEPMLYENLEAHVSLKRSGHWKVAYYARSGQLILEAKTGTGTRASARVEIFGNSGPVVAPIQDSVKEVQTHIERIRMLYELDSVAIIQSPTRLQDGDSEVVTALIGLPVAELPDDAAINQVGGHEPGVNQLIEIRMMTDSSGCAILVFLYPGRSEVLNVEAEGIVKSIRFTCPAM